ncbi:MAG: FAD-dependent oxidoreductase [Candidatus Lokiarchaeota archaeon]|nr:FAD-dependent oxidoreductase [Candidatus Lokiarchaeota archaeon]MBD3337920.1 FAD-dependent oxidoreductase [Candidatus Lokiarchaeota archaeon]
MSDKDEQIRIGVFVCHCGSNIGGLIDCKELANYAKLLPNVAHSENNLYTCSENGLNSIKNAIEEYNLNRVVVASCTPRTHEILFRNTIQEAGLNQYLFNFVNIRDQCSWVHIKFPNKAYKKAQELIKMGVAKAAKLEPLENIKIDINPSALVIGGGVAGMSAALSLSQQGYKTYIVERENELGGVLNNLYKLFPSNQKADELLKDMIEKISECSNITKYLSSNIIEINGYVGNFEVKIIKNRITIDVQVGVIIVAVGSSIFKPHDMYGYDGKIRITQLELERKLDLSEVDAENIVMIQCVGSRDEYREYCSNICCMTALKNALILKKENPERKIIILFRDIYTPGVVSEEYYKKARENGIIFIRYSLENKPKVEEDKVIVFNNYLGNEVSIPYDLLVLSTPLVANDNNKDLAKQLKVPLEENNFFLEAHVKLRPVDFATDGVYVAGSAKWPTNIAEAISQGYAAASRASTLLSHKTLEVEGATANLPEWNKELCKGCEVCIKVCPYNAIKKTQEDDIEIIRALCKGCGTCAATCTKKAITIKHFTNEQIISEILALGGREIV